jgi:DNA invertase Pin-like site-specific DNA recombinase
MLFGLAEPMPAARESVSPDSHPRASSPPTRGGLAEFERRARTSEGRERARARGVRMGRPPKLTPHQRREALRRRNCGTETQADIARSYNVSPATISRLGL